MVIELAWWLFFVNYLTDGEDKRRKVGERENGDLRSIDVSAGNGFRGACCVLRVLGSPFEFGNRYARKVGSYETGKQGEDK